MLNFVNCQAALKAVLPPPAHTACDRVSWQDASFERHRTKSAECNLQPCQLETEKYNHSLSLIMMPSALHLGCVHACIIGATIAGGLGIPVVSVCLPVCVGLDLLATQPADMALTACAPIHHMTS